MKLIDLHIIEFGCLKDLHLTPSEGITVISGDNESGKSTVWLFIKFMLYGLPKRGSPEREKAISRDGHRAAGSMTVEVDGERYEIERSYIDSVGRGAEKKKVWRESDAKVVFADKEPGDALLGVPVQIFESSCGIGQSCCANMGGKKEASAIRNLLTSADESVDISDVENRLDKIRVYYRHRRGDGGRIPDLNSAIAREKQNLDKAVENHKRKEKLREQILRNKATLKQDEKELAKLDAMLGEISKIEVLRRFDRLRQNREELEDLNVELTRYTAEHLTEGVEPTPSDIATLRVLGATLGREDAAVREAKRTYEACEAARSAVRESEACQGERLEAEGGRSAVLNRVADMKKRATLGVVGAVVGAMLVVGGILCLALVQPPIGAGLSVLGVGAMLSLLLCVKGRKAITAIAASYGTTEQSLADKLETCAAEWEKKQETQAALSASEEGLHQAEKRQKQAAEALAECLNKTAPICVATQQNAEDEAKRLSTVLNEVHRSRDSIRTLQKAIADAEETLSVYDEAEIRKTLSVREIDLNDADIGKAKDTRRFYADKVEKMRDRENMLRAELISLEQTGEDFVAIGDRLSTMKAEAQECEEYFDALTCAMDAIHRAGERMRGNVLPSIARNAGQMMEQISGGKYGAMRLGNELDADLVEQNGSTATGETLSGGTRDAAYLCLRVALMRQIFGESLPPLMLDEALCQSDDGRAERILSLLASLSNRGCQCLIFTCHKREGEICRSLGIPFSEIILENCSRE